LKGKDFKLIDISLIGENPAEEVDIAISRNFFAERPGLGTFVSWPLWGVNASSHAAACHQQKIAPDVCKNPTMQQHVYREGGQAGVVDLLAGNFLVDSLSDQLLQRTAQLRAWLTKRHKRPWVIYFHCECGCDRTGELTSAYAMRYLNMSYVRTMNLDTKMIGRTIDYCNQLAVQWFCLSLLSSGSYHFPNDCENCKDWSCYDKWHDCDGYRGSNVIAPPESRPRYRKPRANE
jgi:hypothetical protein